MGCAGLGTFDVAARMRREWRKVRWGGGRGEIEGLLGGLGGALLLLGGRWRVKGWCNCMYVRLGCVVTCEGYLRTVQSRYS